MAENNKQSIEEEIRKLIPGITESVAAELRQKAINSLTHEIQQAVSGEVRQYMADVVVPLVKKELVAKQTEIVAAMVASIQLTMEALSAKTVEEAKRQLDTYDGRKLLGDIFGTLFKRY